MKSTKIKTFLIGFFILGILNIPNISFAETQIEIQEGEIDVETIPNNPQPYEEVKIVLSSYATDLNKAIISWQSETGTVLSGIGKTSYTFKAGGPNTSNTFNISITPAGSMSSITKFISIIPSEIEIMWESADGYTPPFYKGKSLPVSGGLIKAVAIPNTNTIKSGSGSITYTWKNLGSTVLEASGYNKNSYTFKNDLFNDKNEVTVIASSVEGGYKAEKTIRIPIYTPKIVFYKKSPTEGTLYNNALNKEATMTEDEMTIVAEPYFISLKNKDKNFTYKWQINGNNITTPSKKTELTVRPTSRGGYATIQLDIENISELFQKVGNQLKLKL
ncbi:MAG TPA: hypothetical protein VK153_03475 [Candidatus Paceibacterota bacterium]|nr:hypothetical protein [Candidatus Paceibacterota bacterium]